MRTRSAALDLSVGRHLLLVLMSLCVIWGVLGTGPPAAPSRENVSVIVRETGEIAGPAIDALGGTITRTLPTMGIAVAEIPRTRLTALQQTPGVLSVTSNAGVHLLGTVDGVDPNRYPGSWLKVAHNTHLIEMWHNGWTGKGVDVALIDSGVAPGRGPGRQRDQRARTSRSSRRRRISPTSTRTATARTWPA